MSTIIGLSAMDKEGITAGGLLQVLLTGRHGLIKALERSLYVCAVAVIRTIGPF